MAVAAVVCGCSYRWVLSNVVVVVPGVSDDGGSSGGGGLNFSRVHGFTYVSHYTGPRLSRRLGGCTSGHGPRTQILATFVSTAFSLVVLVSSYTRCADARTCSLHAPRLRLCPIVLTEIRAAFDLYVVALRYGKYVYVRALLKGCDVSLPRCPRRLALIAEIT